MKCDICGTEGAEHRFVYATQYDGTQLVANDKIGAFRLCPDHWRRLINNLTVEAAVTLRSKEADDGKSR